MIVHPALWVSFIIKNLKNTMAGKQKSNRVRPVAKSILFLTLQRNNIYCKPLSAIKIVTIASELFMNRLGSKYDRNCIYF